ncbi:MAG: FHA domain-containing protein [Synechococcaceae cyanobacterium SM2_3_2]|nr:FHA domain-containing protein [Synechococcaceae cyanobacterium SM2_3_2]
MDYLLKVTDSLGTRLIPLGADRRWWEIGRSGHCQIVIRGSHVSRKQCTLLHLPIGTGDAQPTWILQDGSLSGNASLNGTWLNQDPVQRKQIQLGDIIYLGSPDNYVVLLQSTPATIPSVEGLLPAPSEDLTQPIIQDSRISNTHNHSQSIDN